MGTVNIEMENLSLSRAVVSALSLPSFHSTHLDKQDTEALYECGTQSKTHHLHLWAAWIVLADSAGPGCLCPSSYWTLKHFSE